MGIIRDWIYEMGDTFLDLIFPSGIYCINCDAPIYNKPYGLCDTCREKITWIKGRTCGKCGKPLENWYFPDTCRDCLNEKHFFTKGFSCAVYDDSVKKIIIDLKYNGKGYYAKHIAEIMYQKLNEQNLQIDCIIPVPLHPKKQKERGYNQSYLLAKHLAHLSQTEINDRILIRNRYTQSQNKLSLINRQKNIKNAFTIINNGYICNKNILLVDDVYTTGNTVDACCKEMMRYGVKNIYIITPVIGKNE